MKAKQRAIRRWEHEAVLETVQKRLDQNPDAMRTRRETVEHPFGTMKMRIGATHFLCKTLPKVATEMALGVLTYNLTRVLNIVGFEKLMEAFTAKEESVEALSRSGFGRARSKLKCNTLRSGCWNGNDLQSSVGG